MGKNEQRADIPYGVGVIVAKDGGFLCAARGDSGEICGPGGFIKEGETPEQAAMRETKEEFGITPKTLYKLGGLLNNKNLYCPAVIFVCTDFDGEPKCDGKEMIFPAFINHETLKDGGMKFFPAFEDSIELFRTATDEFAPEETEESAPEETDDEEETVEKPENEETPDEESEEAPEQQEEEPDKEEKAKEHRVSGTQLGAFENSGEEALIAKFVPEFPADAELSYNLIVGEFMEALTENLEKAYEDLSEAYENENPTERNDSLYGAFGDSVDKFVNVVAAAAGALISELIVKRIKLVVDSVRKSAVKGWSETVWDTLEVEVDEDYYDDEFFGDLTTEWTEENIQYIENTTGSMIDKMAGDFMQLYIAGVAVMALHEQMSRRKQSALKHLNFITGDQISKLNAGMYKLEFLDAGVDTYEWVTRKDDRVREWHRNLEGQIFSFDDPPEMESGEHCNPGEDYNCRCVAVPVFKATQINIPFDATVHDSFFPEELNETEDGGPGSGNWGHTSLNRVGSKGGGSDPGGGRHMRLEKQMMPDGHYPWSEYHQREQKYTGLVWAYRANEVYKESGKEAAAEFMGVTPESFTKKAEKKTPPKVGLEDLLPGYSNDKENKSAQAVLDYINNAKDANPEVVSLYKKMGQKAANDVPIFIEHTKDSHVGGAKVGSHYIYIEVDTPKINKRNSPGAILATLHEWGHLMDILCRDKITGNSYTDSGKQGSALIDAITKHSISDADQLPPKLKALADEGRRVLEEAKDKHWAPYDKEKEALINKFFPDGNIVKSDPKYRQYVREQVKLDNAYKSKSDAVYRNALNGLDAFADILDALSGGKLATKHQVCGGHTEEYFSDTKTRANEIFAEYCELSISRPDLISVLNAELPDLGAALDDVVKAMNA